VTASASGQVALQRYSQRFVGNHFGKSKTGHRSSSLSIGLTCMKFNDGEGETWVKFEQPLDARIMAIDGTWSSECLLIDVSETGAQIKLTSPVADLMEFFLVLSSFGNPVYRRCKRASVHGPLIGVFFQKGGSVGEKTLKDLRRAAELV
jgi:hypothetical protein